ncbi:uncharacterized protein LOC123698937 [Colias croceus]|uniref:uncharacterized protein LOC123698937 n=1 Tax=Colias crocea TaxID=72248 RepID=UPI001E27EA0C|nr:uncharacterized protein LOC123698937 [Colias croceus]
MERLIESVRKYPCLWKTDSEEYKSNDLKEAAWREVTRECELPGVKEARSTWKKLRDGHRQAIGRKKTVTGQAASTKTPWKYETQMEFLLPIMKNRKRSTDIDPVPRSSQGNSRNSDEIESQQNAESPNHVVELPYGELVPPNKKTTLVSLLEKEHKRREERSVARTELRNQIQGASTSTTQNSAMDTFFKSMQLTTNALPERLQLKVQRQIFNIVMEAKEEHLTTLALTANSQPLLLPINKYSPRSASSSSNYSQISPPQQLSPT